MRKITFILFHLWFFSSVFAQDRIEVDPNGTPEASYNPKQLIENVLINSPCATISNVTFKSGDSFGFKSYGYFRKGSSQFPLENGIILSTASASSSIGPNDQNENSEGEGTGWTGDTDMEKILDRNLPGSFPTFNATVFEFDFIPFGNQLSFDYLFASEEYDQDFICASSFFQDGFAFIISGPGITNDPDIDGKNITLINNSSTPVSAGTINGGDLLTFSCGPRNQQFYYSYANNNVSGISGSTTPANAPIDFMGRTTVFTAKSDVIPNEKYHIKLVVAERADGRLASAVFLAGGSFNIGIDLGGDRSISGNNPLCQGETLTLDAGTFAGATYKWFETSNPSVTLGTASTYTVISEGTYKVEVSLGSACISTDEIQIEYSLPPTINPSVTLKQCDNDTDGFSDFNLEEANILITSDTSVAQITYYTSRLLAQRADLANRITNPTAYNSNTSSIFARVENQFGCFDISEVNLVVSTTNIPSNFMLNFNECDTTESGSDIDGISTFNFSAATAEILKLFPSGQALTVTYYKTIADGLAEQNAINAANYQNTDVPNKQQIVVRVDSNDNNDCLGLGFHVTLTVDPLPAFDLQDEAILCLNNLPLTVSSENAQGNYTYQWYDNSDNPLTNGNTTLYVFNSAGQYKLTATITDSTNCSRTKTITIKESNIATIDNIIVRDDSENNTITVEVSGEGDYEFALDDINGPYQNESLIQNVSAGLHTVFIRDKKGCGIVNREVSVIGFPRFFTPNGDGVNDSWQVLGIEFQPNSKIYVFDRYGKLLAQIDARNSGWNGTYNGNPLPASDYWFLVELEDGRVRRGHFSLIRR